MQFCRATCPKYTQKLGDLLLHIVFYAQMEAQTNDFDIYDVCNGLCEKLIYRHPHIFGDVVTTVKWWCKT